MEAAQLTDYGTGCTVITQQRGMGYVMRGFRVTKVTVRKWMSKLGMPYLRIKGEKCDNIRFEMEKVLPWAQDNGKIWYEPQGRLRLK
jgi:hypothetical protein